MSEHDANYGYRLTEVERDVREIEREIKQVPALSARVKGLEEATNRLERTIRDLPGNFRGSLIAASAVLGALVALIEVFLR